MQAVLSSVAPSRSAPSPVAVSQPSSVLQGVRPQGFEPQGLAVLRRRGEESSSRTLSNVRQAVAESRPRSKAKAKATTKAQARAKTSIEIPLMMPDLWALLVLQLPQKFEFDDYTVAEIACLFNVDTHALRKYCREIWPGWRSEGNGHYRFEWSQAVYLIYRACRDPRNLGPVDMVRRDLYIALRESKRITTSFPMDSEVITRAMQAIKKERALFAARRSDPRYERRSCPRE